MCRAILANQIYPVRADRGQVRRRPRIASDTRVKAPIRRCNYNSRLRLGHGIDGRSRSCSIGMRACRRCARRRSSAGGPAPSMRGGPGVYLPLKGRRPPRGEGSEVPVLEGACLGSSPRREFCRPSTFRAPGPRSGEVRCRFPGRRPGRSGDSLQWSGVDARAGRAIRISAHRRVGLTLNRDSTMGRFLNPQERHNVFSQEKRRIRPHVTAEVAAGRHSRVPANLTELAVLAASEPGWRH